MSSKKLQANRHFYFNKFRSEYRVSNWYINHPST